ncbi:carboxylesterase/lipase family protein [Parahaliea maris]|nr:carboxylesterase family protein [Parahaliea maris]
MLAASLQQKPALTGESLLVETSEGVLRGVQTEALNVFKGIRYGEATSGHYRFRRPQPVQPWVGTRDALSLGSPAPQDSRDLDAWQDPLLPGSEDCLFLNLWAPRGRSEALPVMIFIHGGAYHTGSGGVPLYDCAALAEGAGAVVLNLNHRLNLFGYLYLGGIGNDYDANVGQLDIIEALRWVQRNIAAFGGDPANVTLFGESGGGLKISTLLGMPEAKGLFSKAIVQSGSQTRVRSPEAASREAMLVLNELAISPRDVDKIAEVDTSTLISVAQKVTSQTWSYELNSMPFSPVLDATTVPYQLDTRASREIWSHVPLLVGTNEAEAALYYYPQTSLPALPDDRALHLELANICPWLTPGERDLLVQAFRKYSPSASREEVLIGSGSLAWFWKGALKQAELKAQMDAAPVYTYLFGWRDPVLGGQWATHATELVFLFDHLDMNDIWDDTDISGNRAKGDPSGHRFELRDAIISSWGAFAATGNPSSKLTPSWPVYTQQSRSTMRIDTQWTVVDEPYGPHLRRLVQDL